MSGGEGITVDVILPMEKAGSERARRAAVARKLGISPSRIRDLRLVKESIDSRQKKILFQLRLLVGVDEQLPPERLPSRDYPPVRPGSPVALIIGFGPAGMFAALRCLELGIKPVVLERGKDVPITVLEREGQARFPTESCLRARPREAPCGRFTRFL